MSEFFQVRKNTTLFPKGRNQIVMVLFLIWHLQWANLLMCRLLLFLRTFQPMLSEAHAGGRRPGSQSCCCRISASQWSSEEMTLTPSIPPGQHHPTAHTHLCGNPPSSHCVGAPAAGFRQGHGSAPMGRAACSRLSWTPPGDCGCIANASKRTRTNVLQPETGAIPGSGWAPGCRMALGSSQQWWPTGAPGNATPGADVSQSWI